jgi:membrane protein implicated in regulation of membrane protease activity
MLDQLFSGYAAWFAVPAIVGTAVFLMRLVLMLVGGAAGDLDFSVDHVGADLHHGDPGHALQILSIQSLFAFAMGFGWVGLGGLKGGWGFTPSLLAGVAGGVGMVWLLGLLLKGVHDLQSSGNVSIDSAMGREGDVYATIPAGGQGRGQVRVTLSQRQRIYNAVTEGEELPSSTRVRVTKVNQDNTLTVARA